ncbi:putative membrane protein [Wickerhamomyces ciferrii]|uniref:Membrane protein n=1 Tax=Wickerhamomyces ciferrii (strain ATCC 14091 / BCRC 22168 / CBS 111 / JCM 3599 / NBRC 0793 / NRRL Y-1031 F-60-10) TaxID=1206466 RepID=K0KID6_WICCF|nr:uncharacterized protein BN7_696 [Wickerhamomyces ciferrii]CCH41159.1 putative membrane protein [Wickerhamomyces ciferrii]
MTNTNESHHRVTTDGELSFSDFILICTSMENQLRSHSQQRQINHHNYTYQYKPTYIYNCTQAYHGSQSDTSNEGQLHYQQAHGHHQYNYKPVIFYNCSNGSRNNKVIDHDSKKISKLQSLDHLEPDQNKKSKEQSKLQSLDHLKPDQNKKSKEQSKLQSLDHLNPDQNKKNEKFPWLDLISIILLVILIPIVFMIQPMSISFMFLLGTLKILHIKESWTQETLSSVLSLFLKNEYIKGFDRRSRMLLVTIACQIILFIIAMVLGKVMDFFETN